MQEESSTIATATVRHPKAWRERGYQLFIRGAKLDEIAASLGIPLGTVQGWSSKEKWRERYHTAAKKAETLARDGGADDVPTSRRIADDKTAPLEALQAEYRSKGGSLAMRIADAFDEMTAKELVQHADKVKKLDEVARKALDLETAKIQTVVNVAFLATPAPSALLPAASVIEAEVVSVQSADEA